METRKRYRERGSVRSDNKRVLSSVRSHENSAFLYTFFFLMIAVSCKKNESFYALHCNVQPELNFRVINLFADKVFARATRFLFQRDFA